MARISRTSPKRISVLTSLPFPDLFEEFYDAYNAFQKTINTHYDTILYPYFDYDRIFKSIYLTGHDRNNIDSFILHIDTDKVVEDYFKQDNRVDKISSHEKMSIITRLTKDVSSIVDASHRFITSAADLLECINLNPSLARHDLEVMMSLQIGIKFNAGLCLYKGVKRKIPNLGKYKTKSEIFNDMNKSKHMTRKSSMLCLNDSFIALSRACHTLATLDRGEMKNHYKITSYDLVGHMQENEWKEENSHIRESINIMADTPKSALFWAGATQSHDLLTLDKSRFDIFHVKKCTVSVKRDHGFPWK